MSDPRFYARSEVIALLRLGDDGRDAQTSLRTLMTYHNLPHRRIGHLLLFPRAEFDNWLKAQGLDQ